MRTTLLAGAAVLALAPAQLLAQDAIPDQVTGYENSGEIDAVIADDTPAAATVAPTGDPVLDRLNALEAKIQQLEARNRQLEEQAAETTTRVEKVEVRAAKSVQAGPSFTFSDVPGSFTFRPRGVIQLDYAGFNERAGGYDYNNGTDIRRARFGFDGTAWKDFKWRIEAEYVKGNVNLLDAYISYNLNKSLLLTVGQHKAPYGLEANTSDSFNTFLERGMFTNAFGSVAAERRVGLSLAYASDKLNAQLGLFGTGEAVQRNATTPDEGYSGNARVTWDPILDTGKVVHLGVSGFVATNFGGNSLTISERPNVRVDNAVIISAPIAGTAIPGGPQTGAQNANYIGTEAAVVFGPFSAQGEWGRLKINRFGAAKPVTFDGFYGFASWFITGESRSFKGGNVDRLKPTNEFNPAADKWGAWELAVRYDQLDLTDHDLSPLHKKATNWTGAVNWYLNGNLKLLFNYIRFKGTNSPLVVAPVSENGTTAKGEAFATRLHLDF